MSSPSTTNISKRKKVKEQIEKKSALKGAVAGFLSSVFLQPLEVLKVNMILIPREMKSVKKEGIFSAFAKATKIIYNTEGIAGFFRGISPAVIRAVSASTIFFYSLDKLNCCFEDKTSKTNLLDFGVSASARVISSVLTNPFTLLKTRAGMIGNDKYSSVIGSFGLIYKNEGIRGFFKGTVAMVVRDFPFGGIFYVVYNASNSILEEYSKSKAVFLTSGMIAGVVATVATQPLEIVKSKLQANTGDPQDMKSIPGILKEIYKKEGFRGYSRGLAPLLLRKPLINAMTFFFFEMFNEDDRTKRKLKKGAKLVAPAMK